MTDDKWIKFTSELRPHLQTTDERILFMLLRKYESTSEEFRRSQAADVFQDCLAQIRAHPSRTYVSLVELKKKLKAHHQCGDDETKAVPPPSSPFEAKSPQGPPQQLSISTSPLLRTPRTPVEPNAKPLPSLPSLGEVDSSSSRVSESLQPASATGSTDGGSTTVTSLHKVESPECPDDDAIDNPKLYRLMVQSLEHKLEFISSEIRKLEEAELDLADLDDADSPYLRLDRLKRQHLRVWNQLCRVRKISPRCGRVLRRRFAYNGSRFASVNRAVENMVNANKNFPDFVDIRRLVEDVLVKNQNVKMSQNALNCLAREVFIDVGRLLKDRRQKDIMTDFGCHLTDAAQDQVDPAVADPELRSLLRSNKKRGAAKLEEVLTKYSRLQEAYEDGLATTTTELASDVGGTTASEPASLAPTPALPPVSSPAPATDCIPAPLARSPLVLHSPPLEEQLSLVESAATLDTVIIIESDDEVEEEEDLESHASDTAAAAAATTEVTVAQTANQRSPLPLDHLQLPSAFIADSDDEAAAADDGEGTAVLPLDPASQAEVCESMASASCVPVAAAAAAVAEPVKPALRGFDKEEEEEVCISVDCDGVDDNEMVDFMQQQQQSSGAAVVAPPPPDIQTPDDNNKKSGDEPLHSEVSLLDSDDDDNDGGEKEVDAQKTKPPSPQQQQQDDDDAAAPAVEPNAATISSSMPPGTEVISIDSDGEEEERKADDDDDEPQVVGCSLPPKATAPRSFDTQRSSGRFVPPNFHPSAFSLGSPQMVTQISEQRVISVSTNVYGGPVTSARIVQQRQDFVFPSQQHDSFYPPPLMMPRGFLRFPSHAWHPSPYQRFFQSNF